MPDAMTLADRLTIASKETRAVRLQLITYRTLLAARRAELVALLPSYVLDAVTALDVAIDRWTADESRVDAGAVPLPNLHARANGGADDVRRSR